MFEIDVPVQYDSRLFLSRTFARGEETGEITRVQSDVVKQDIAMLSHKLILVKTQDVSSHRELRQQVQNAFVLISLGLEYGSDGDADNAVQLLIRNRIVKLFQIGNTLVSELVKYAQTTLQKAVLVSPESSESSTFAPQPIPVYNKWEQELVAEIDEYNLVIDAPHVLIRGISAPRPLIALMDLSIVRQQIDNINYRLTYLQALPLKKIFETEYPSNIDEDAAREITMALMVNLLLYQEIHFHLDSDDFESFREVAYDADSGSVRKESKDRLICWIVHYLDLASLPEEVKSYAVAYWRECLNVMRIECE